MNPVPTPDKKQPAAPPVTLRRMPDGSFRIYGLRQRSRLHLTREMRPWRRDEDPATGETYYESWSYREAQTYAVAHGLTILTPTAS